MINIEANLKHWNDDDYEVAPSSKISVNNFVWNKLLARTIIQVLEDLCGKDNEIIKSIKNKNFSQLKIFSEELPWNNKIEGYINNNCFIVTNNEYDALMNMLATDEILDKFCEFYKEAFGIKSKKCSVDDNYNIWGLLYEYFPHILKSADDTTMVELSYISKVSLELVYDFLQGRYGDNGKEIEFIRKRINSKEDYYVVCMEHLLDCGVPKNVAHEYIIDSIKDINEIENDELFDDDILEVFKGAMHLSISYLDCCILWD